MDESSQIILVTPNDSDNHTAASDLCSPLCICSCCSCSGVEINILQVSIEHVPAIVEESISSYSQVSFHQPSFSIWQPPKV
jgi:hypothetical protein